MPVPRFSVRRDCCKEGSISEHAMAWFMNLTPRRRGSRVRINFRTPSPTRLLTMPRPGIFTPSLTSTSFSLSRGNESALRALLPLQKLRQAAGYVSKLSGNHNHRGAIVLGPDFRYHLHPAQFERGRIANHHLRRLGQFLRRLQFRFRLDDTGSL